MAGRLRPGSAATRLQGWRVRIPPVVWMSLPCECCALSGRGLYVGLISRPEESYRVYVCLSVCVCVCVCVCACDIMLGTALSTIRTYIKILPCDTPVATLCFPFLTRRPCLSVRQFHCSVPQHVTDLTNIRHKYLFLTVQPMTYFRYVPSLAVAWHVRYSDWCKGRFFFSILILLLSTNHRKI